MILQTDIPEDLWVAFKGKMVKNTDQPWTDNHVESFLQTILIEYIVSTVDE